MVLACGFSENEGASEKGCLEIEDWSFSVHFVLGCASNKISFTLYSCVLAKILQYGAKFRQKLIPDFKNHMRNLNIFRQAVESWNLMPFCPKNAFLQLKHYIQRIYLTLLSTTCVKIHQITYVIFETISHFSRHNSSLVL